MNASLNVFNRAVRLGLLDPNLCPIACGPKHAPGFQKIVDAYMVIAEAYERSKISGQRIATFRIVPCKKCGCLHVTRRLVGERRWGVA